jgi:hypothetical protein
MQIEQMMPFSVSGSRTTNFKSFKKESVMKLVTKLFACLTTELLVKLLNYTLEQHEYMFQSLHALQIQE